MLVNPGITIKPYPNCWAHHKVLQAVLEMKAEHQIDADDVKAVYVDLQKSKPTYRYLLPETDLEARYSLGYGIAVALLDGELTLKQYKDERICSEPVRDMIARIVDTPANDPVAQQTVKIVLKDGREFSKRVEFSKGHPLYDPMTIDETVEKFRLQASMILTESAVERAIDQILHLDEVDDFSKVMDTLIM